MNQTDSKTHIRNGIHHLCRQVSRLNLYVQNTRILNTARVAAELKNLSTQLEDLSYNLLTNQGGIISREQKLFKKTTK